MDPAQINQNSVVRQSLELVSSVIDDQIALMSVQNGAYYGLDPVGSRIWALIKNRHRVGAICDQMIHEYNIDRPTCERQVLDFLQRLAKSDLIIVEQDADAPDS